MTAIDAARAPTQAPVPRTKGRRFTSEAVVRAMFVVPAAVYMVMFFGYPVVKNLTMSFQDYTTRTFFTGEAPWVGLQNYVTTVSDALFQPALLNTALFTLGSLTGQFAVGMALAVFFAKRFPLNSLIRALLLLPWLIPLIVASATWRSLMDYDSGIINVALRALGLDGVLWLTSPSVALIAVIIVNIWVGIPFNVAILYGGIKEIPEELYEAASLDGCVRWRAFRYITWPLLHAVVGVVLVLGVVYTLKVIDIILGLTNGGPANATQTLAIRSYQTSFVDFEFGVGAAYSNILVLISLLFAIIYLRSLRRGSEA